MFKDQLNRTVKISKPPCRIVSLVPSQTELLVDMGLRDRLVGISKFCVHPPELRKEITVVGGTKNVHFNRISALNPDFILCNKEENSLEMVQRLEEIAPVWISDIFCIEDCLEMIRLLGKIFATESRSLELITAIDNARVEFREFMMDIPVKRVIYLIWRNPYMAAGRNTFINEILSLNKFENIIAEIDSRYPQVEGEIFAKADKVLLSTEPYPFNQQDAVELIKKGNKEVLVVDGEYFSWYGSRLIRAFQYFKTLH